MPAADQPDRPAPDPPPAAPTAGLAATVPDPVPPAEDEVDLGAFTIRQVDPPSFLASGSAGSATGSASGSQRHSGQEVRKLDRLIDRSRAAEADVAEGYRLLGRLGIGAFGTVWEAEDEATGERVAIKFLTSSDIRWERMLDEVRVLQKMENTPGIVAVKVVRQGADGRPPYYVMPLANGGSLADRIEQARPARPPGQPVLPTDEVVRLFTRVAESLAAVHRRGILHCDLKPRNILLHSPARGEPDEPLIADFGQAHLATDDTPALGTFFYMPPDQAAAGRTKARPDTGWDVYALGAILYEMVVGEAPRKSPGLVGDLKNTTHLETKLRRYEEGVRAAPPPVGHRKLVDPLLARLIDRCLSLDPRQRPRDAGEVVTALRAREWWRQTRPVLAFGAAATALILAFLLVVGWAAAREVSRETEQNVTRELRGNLARTAWFGKQAVEERLREHVAFVERHSRGFPKDHRDRLTAAADRVAALERAYTRADVPAADRDALTAWTANMHRTRLAPRWGENAPSMNLVLAAGGRAYILTRVHPDGRAEDHRAADENTRKVFETNFAFRDYYNGTEDQADRNGTYQPITRTHVSQVYRAITGRQSWMVDVSTPIWADDSTRERVVGVLRLGIRLEEDLLHQLRVPEGHLPGDGDRPDAGRVGGAKVVLVDDRDRWVWHREGMARLKEAGVTTGTDDYADLAAARPGGAARWYPWKGSLGGGRAWSGVYTDPVRAQATGEEHEEIAHAVALDPYGASEYPQNKGREWAFVVRVDKEAAVRPIAELRGRLVSAGSVVFVALAALAAGLWVWLLRVLRGRGFSTHG